MTGPEVVKLADEIAAKVAERFANPVDQNAELRRIAQAVGISVARVRWNSKLQLSAFAIVDEANRQGVTATEIAAVI